MYKKMGKLERLIGGSVAGALNLDLTMSATGRNKRHREDSEQTEQKSKRQKKTKNTGTIGDRLENATVSLKDWLALLRPFAAQHGLRLDNASRRVDFLEAACNHILRNPANTPEALLSFFKDPLTLDFVEKPEIVPTATKGIWGV
jgi:hypothetical protein